MRKLSVTFAIAALLGFAAPAKAGVLIDPYFGYAFMGKTEAKFGTGLGGGTSKADLSGITYGGRLGYALPVVFFGIDYQLGTLTAKPEGGGSNSDVATSDLYAMVGAQIPVLRGYIGYGLMNESKNKPSSGGDSTLYGGTHIKLGVGYTGLPFVAINLEYRMDTYAKYKSGSIDQTMEAAGILESASASTTALVISVPFNL